MIAPELPTGIAICLPIFHHHADCQINHTMGVMAAGWCHIAQVCHEIPVAFLTMMLGVGEMKLNRSSRDQIAYVMQAPLVDMLSFCALPTDRAGAFFLIADFLRSPWLLAGLRSAYIRYPPDTRLDRMVSLAFGQKLTFSFRQFTAKSRSWTYFCR